MTITARPDWMTLSELRDYISTMVRDNSLTDANLNAYINRAYRWMFYDQLWPTRKTTGTITLATDTASYELPSDLATLESASYGNNEYLVQTRGQNKAEFGTNNTNSYGRRLIVNGYEATVQPTPGAEDNGETLDLNYWQTIFVYDASGAKVDGIMDADTEYPALPGPLHKLLADRAGILAMAFNREDGRAPQDLERHFIEEYRKIIFTIITQNSYPNQLRIRL
jgi:hypothetical protein